jgi:hypothetical protein
LTARVCSTKIASGCAVKELDLEWRVVVEDRWKGVFKVWLPELLPPPPTIWEPLQLDVDAWWVRSDPALQTTTTPFEPATAISESSNLSASEEYMDLLLFKVVEGSVADAPSDTSSINVLFITSSSCCGWLHATSVMEIETFTAALWVVCISCPLLPKSFLECSAVDDVEVDEEAWKYYWIPNIQK